MTEHGNDLRKAAETLRRASCEINLACRQSTRSRHLFIRTRRTAVQASRAVANLVDLGFHEVWPGGASLLSKRRHPDQPLGDDAAFSFWKIFICPAIRGRQSTSKADAGAFDFSPVKTDGEGRILGRDGQPLTKVEETEDAEGGSVGCRLSGPAARVSDDYDEVETLEHLRCQAADWADVCDDVVDLILRELTITEPRPQKSEVRTKKSTSGGDAQALIIPALTVHHDFDGDGCQNLTPIGVNELARLAEVASSTVSLFFQRNFASEQAESGEGLRNYRRACRNDFTLSVEIRKLRGEAPSRESWNSLADNHGDQDGRTTVKR